MDAIECTHCRVLMTGWRAPGSTVQYWQCPFCGRTHSSPYDEVFRAGAGARVVRARPAGPGTPPRGLPVATPAEVSLTLLKARAARWFARLRADERPALARLPDAAQVPRAPALALVSTAIGRPPGAGR